MSLPENSYDDEDLSEARTETTDRERISDMIEHDGLMRVFWPTDIPKSDRPGVVVGWRNSNLDVFVVAVLDDVDVSACKTGRIGHGRLVY